MQVGTPRIIGRGKLNQWVAHLMSRAEVIAPTAGQTGDVLFLPIESPEQVAWQFENTLHPPKQFLLPQTEPIVAIRRNEGYEVEPIYDERKRIIFAVRNCDVSGIKYLDQVQNYELTDAYYAKRRQNTMLISLACNRPCERCFCICSGSGPFLEEGYDLQLTDMGGKFLAEPGTEQGEAVLAEAAGLFEPASDRDTRRRHELEEAARASFADYTCHFASAMRRISTRKVDESLWASMGDWCLQCGGCNLICPTCYCFSVKDRAVDGVVMRQRMWDSCQYAAFTLEASGHNPRPDRKDRMKRRFFHKVSAQYTMRDGMVGCVGCGRCITVCMGTTDMPAIARGVRKGVWNG